MLPKSLKDLENLDEEKLAIEYANNVHTGDKLAKFKEAMSKIDVSKLFNNSDMTSLDSLKQKYFGDVSKYDEKMNELDHAIAVVTEQLEKNPLEAKKILEQELAKAKKLQESLTSTISKIPENGIDLNTILNKIN